MTASGVTNGSVDSADSLYKQAFSRCRFDVSGHSMLGHSIRFSFFGYFLSQTQWIALYPTRISSWMALHIRARTNTHTYYRSILWLFKPPWTHGIGLWLWVVENSDLYYLWCPSSVEYMHAEVCRWSCWMTWTEFSWLTNTKNRLQQCTSHDVCQWKAS